MEAHGGLLIGHCCCVAAYISMWLPSVACNFDRASLAWTKSTSSFRVSAMLQESLPMTAEYVSVMRKVETNQDSQHVEPC